MSAPKIKGIFNKKLSCHYKARLILSKWISWVCFVIQMNNSG